MENNLETINNFKTNKNLKNNTNLETTSQKGFKQLFQKKIKKKINNYRSLTDFNTSKHQKQLQTNFKRYKQQLFQTNYKTRT